MRSACAAIAALLAALVLAVSAHAAGTWTYQATTGTTQPLFGGACTDVQHCWAVGKGGAIIGTTNAGSTWPLQTSGTGQQLNAVACPAASTCYAAGNAGTILKTTDGTTWSTQTSNQTKHFQGIACEDATHCIAVGQEPTKDVDPGIVSTTTDGSTWTARTAAGAEDYLDVDCGDTTQCWAVGKKGGIYVTSNGGTSWAAETSGTGNQLNSIVCMSTSVCLAAGNGNTVLKTTNGGTSWTPLTTGAAGGQNWSGVVCSQHFSGLYCWVVGAGGVIRATTDGGSTWAVQPSGTGNQLNWVFAVNPGRAYASSNNSGDMDQYVDSCSTGGLSLGVGAISFPSLALNGTNRTASTTAVLTPDDETAAGYGWNVAATSTTFTSAGGKTLPTTAATIASTSRAARAGNCSLPTNSVGTPLTVPAGASAPTAVKIYNAAALSGAGPTDVTLNLQLAVPANAYTGSYSSTWTFTVSTGP